MSQLSVTVYSYAPEERISNQPWINLLNVSSLTTHHTLLSAAGTNFTPLCCETIARFISGSRILLSAQAEEE